MQKIGICGLGFMGKMHFEALAGIRGARVTAISTRSAKKRKGDWSGIGGNIAGGISRPDLSGVTTYGTVDELIADDNVDAVDITLPTPLHMAVAMKVLRARKPVIIEKPLAANSRDAYRLVDAFRKARVPLFVAHCIRFWPEYVVAKTIVDSRRYGKVTEASFARLCAHLGRSTGSWRADGAPGGGAALDLHIHDVDFVQYLFGRPARVSAHGDIDHITACYRFDGKDHPRVVAEGGWPSAPGFGFSMNFRIELEDATVTFGWGGFPNRLSVHMRDGRTLFPKVPSGTGYSRELAYFVKCMATRKFPSECPPADAANAVRIVEAELSSAKRSGCWMNV